MATNQSQSTSDEQDRDNSSDEPAEMCASRQQIIEEFGDGGVIDGYEDARYTMGEDRIVVWVPEDNQTPFGIQLSEFSAAPSWAEGDTIIDDENVRVYALIAGNHIHTVEAAKVDAIANRIGTSPESLLEEAETNNAKVMFSPLFAVPEGQVMVSPLILDRADIEFSEPLQQTAD